MNTSNWFDNVARLLANPMPRRRALRLIVGGLAGSALAGLGLGRAWAQGLGNRSSCMFDSQCMSGHCLNGVCCNAGQFGCAGSSGTNDCCQSQKECCNTSTVGICCQPSKPFCVNGQCQATSP